MNSTDGLIGGYDLAEWWGVEKFDADGSINRINRRKK